MSETGVNPEQESINNSIIMLKWLRDEWSDEIPSDILHSSDPDSLYKVRGTWFQGIVSSTENLLDYAPKDAPQLSEIRDLIDYFCNTQEFEQKMASRSERIDINKGNRLINLTLGLFGES